jgi:prepilin-type processing-associated H-X9-DG protein
LDEGNGVPPLTKGTPPDRASSYGYNANFTFVDPKHFGCMDQGDSLPISACTAPGRTILLFEVTNSLWYNVDTETNPSTLPGPNQGTRGGCGGSPAGDGIGGEYQPDGFNSVQNATGPDDGHLKFATGIPAGEVNPKGLLAFSSTGRHQVGGSNYLMADGHSVFLLASVISAGHNAPTSTSDAITDAANQYVAQAAGTSGHLSDGVTVPAATYSVY